jgi:hypothetical protein
MSTPKKKPRFIFEELSVGALLKGHHANQAWVKSTKSQLTANQPHFYSAKFCREKSTDGLFKFDSVMLC